MPCTRDLLLFANHLFFAALFEPPANGELPALAAATRRRASKVGDKKLVDRHVVAPDKLAAIDTEGSESSLS